MTEKEKIWDETRKTCQTHYERMMYASQSLNPYFPLTEETYQEWTPEQIAITDQMIYRFSKLQDTIGNKLFKLILLKKEEDIEGLSFKDILLKLEKLHILEDHTTWLKLRETRNIVTHEYPDNISDVVDGLNLLKTDIKKLSGIWENLRVI